MGHGNRNFWCQSAGKAYDNASVIRICIQQKTSGLQTLFDNALQGLQGGVLACNNRVVILASVGPKWRMGISFRPMAFLSTAQHPGQESITTSGLSSLSWAWCTRNRYYTKMVVILSFFARRNLYTDQTPLSRPFYWHHLGKKIPNTPAEMLLGLVQTEFTVGCQILSMGASAPRGKYA
ncbi:hypothetical protein BS50DRAFT_72865 [Corynespora cassiicola Philippines]|uniref:Uncharacterized protein n=1 Tax=Corynespora cassiicola Philippines TaxID=1448308 RepID=A0A2T2NH86_CORCC|nr:hypothetical protein BS50DRAFT_72865 [Corynespora cassiicola Philippines]